VSCFLIEKSVITVDSLLTGKEPGEYPVDKIIEILTPVYLTKSTRTFVKEYVKKNFKPEQAWKLKKEEN